MWSLTVIPNPWLGRAIDLIRTCFEQVPRAVHVLEDLLTGLHVFPELHVQHPQFMRVKVSGIKC